MRNRKFNQHTNLLFEHPQKQLQNEGFEEQQIQINHQQPFQFDEQIKIETGNQLIQEQRPKDYLPRTIIPYIYFNYPSELDNVQSFQSEMLLTEKRQKVKMKKYKSLYDKYERVKLYEIVYNKFKVSKQQDYLSKLFFKKESYLNLNSIVDYNPNMFRTIGQPNFNENSRFNSNFQSGNLLYAYQAFIQNKVTQNEFDLLLQNDINTKGYNQWFYFSYKNQNTNQAKFNIVNLVKKKNLFAQGVRPVAYYSKQKKWVNVGKNINYYRTMILRQNGEYYYTLSFQIEFPQTYDLVFFALTLPYTYTKMIKFLDFLQKQKSPQIIYQKKILCYSISNNVVPYITLKTQTSTKKILLMARQHPGQAVSSYVLQAFLKQLIRNPAILQKFQIIVIPMVNPDGVIYGNFRTNISGFDLNRQWSQPNKWLHPEIYYLKKLICSLKNIEMVLDFHGHSKKMNSFIYAMRHQDRIQQKLFPYLMSKNEIFSLKQCTYGIAPDKLTTARANINLLNIHNIFTLQTSFYGYTKNSLNYKLTQINYDNLGKTVLQSIFIYYFNNNQLKNIQSQIKIRMCEFEMWQNSKKNDSGSESNPSQDQLTAIQRRQKVLEFSIKKRKIIKTKEDKKLFREKQRTILFFQKDFQNKQKSKFYINQSIIKLHKKTKQHLTSIHATQNNSSTQICKPDKEGYFKKYNQIQIKQNEFNQQDLDQRNYLHRQQLGSSNSKFHGEKYMESWRKYIQSAKGTSRQQQKKQIILQIRPKLRTKGQNKPREIVSETKHADISRIIKIKQIRSQNNQLKSKQKSIMFDKNKTLADGQKPHQISETLTINNNSSLKNSKKIYHLSQPRKIKELKGLDKNKDKKQLIFLGELMRPKINDSQHLVYLNIEQDMKKQFKNKSQLNKYKKKPLFADNKYS